jgi:hypothetical protein
MNHFTRLIDLTSADEEYVAALATSLAPCILRPRVETSLTMEEKHGYKLVRDLFVHKDPIFRELKRMSTLNHSSSASSNRPRAISTDESNRKALMEERNRALVEKATASRSRATSPAPSPRHNRQRSTVETRFPIQTSPVVDRHRTSLGGPGSIKRSSLEVPGQDGYGSPDGTNGTDPSRAIDNELHGDNKRDSGGKSGTRFVGGRRVTNPSPPQESALRGVTLEDAPMAD